MFTHGKSLQFARDIPAPADARSHFNSHSATLAQHLQVSFHDLLLYDFTRRFRITLPRELLDDFAVSGNFG